MDNKYIAKDGKDVDVVDTGILPDITNATNKKGIIYQDNSFIGKDGKYYETLQDVKIANRIYEENMFPEDIPHMTSQRKR